MPSAYISYPPLQETETADTPGVHGPQQNDIRAMIAGQIDPHDPDIDAIIVVNSREFGITGWGDDNNQQFQSGHTNNLPTNESSEQGWGVGPERKWPHYPTPDQPNPFRNLNAFQRSGGDTYSDSIYRPEVVAYWAQAIGYELSQAQVKQRASGYRTINQTPSVPYVATVPAPTSQQAQGQTGLPGGY